MLQALAASGTGSGAIRGGVAYLRSVQLSSGGFPLSGGGANAQSTAWAIQGLLAAGASPGKLRRGGRNPFDYLDSLQAADGHYRYSRSSDQTPVWVTAQALQAAERAPFPLAEVGGATASAASGSGAGASSASGTGGGGGGGGAAAAGGAGAVAGAAGAASPGEAATEAAAGSPARFETDGDDEDTGLLVGGVVLGLAVIVACGVMLNRQSARE